MEKASSVLNLIVWVALIAGVIYVFNQIQASSAKAAAAKRAGRLERANALAERIVNGENLDADTSNLVLVNGEQVIYRTGADLIEERVVSRKWEGGSQGISIPTGILNTKVSFGKTRGKLAVERGNVPVSKGSFVVTTKHLIFSGSGKSTKTPLLKVIDTQLGNNGIIFGVTGRTNPIKVMFHDDIGGVVVGAAIQRAFDGMKAS